MPTGTFFRLPEEKRMRLMESAWEEFTHISYADVSINKIIQAAGIPRGSFYQYFDGKEDLFFYLLDDVRNHFIQALKSLLLDVDGDLFSLPMLAYDQFLQRRERGDPEAPSPAADQSGNGYVPDLFQAPFLFAG